MSNQVLLGTNITDELDAEALRNIWWIYAEEAHAFDQRTISGLHKSLDVRLVFVCIFAVCFIGRIHSYQQPSVGHILSRPYAFHS